MMKNWYHASRDDLTFVIHTGGGWQLDSYMVVLVVVVAATHAWSPLANCRCWAEKQTADHILASRLLYHPPNETLGLATFDDDTVDWIKTTELSIWWHNRPKRRRRSTRDVCRQIFTFSLTHWVGSSLQNHCLYPGFLGKPCTSFRTLH